ncbi:hypothetical protein [Ferruginibacter sp.]
MKHTKTLLILGLFITIMLLHANKTAAQKTSYTQSLIQLTIEGNSISTDNLAITDALGPDNKMIHTASFDITLSNSEVTKSIISSFQSSMKKNKTAQLLFTTINFNGDIQEERTYINTSILEMQLPQLDATAKVTLKIKIKIKAESVQVKQGDDKAISKIGAKSTSAIASNFRIKLGSLPTNRISKISGMSIVQADGPLQNFSLDVSVVDAAPWNEWFLTGAGGVKKEYGTIELLSPDFKTVLITIQLMDVEIISYSQTNNSNQQALAKANIGLRTKSVSIKF